LPPSHEMAGSSPAMTNTDSRQSQAGALARSPGADQAIGDDADEGNREAGNETATGFGLRESDEHLLTEVAGADHGADDDHGKREQYRLVDAKQDLGERHRQLHAPEGLSAGAARHLGGLDKFGRYLANAVIGVADGGNDGERH